MTSGNTLLANAIKIYRFGHRLRYHVVSTTSESKKININLATSTELKTLDGIGEVKANAIIAYREEFGNFSTIEDIKKVNGIKDEIFNRIKDYITV
ncbi:MAG: ComEA family DNA-binding protein [Oscillospiraceae bacterium]|jgi:comEA protein|nr:ComEA family DNA-binding protein [Oscillospiraceae bacterium]